MNSAIPEGKIWIQFDGMCILCSQTVRFILKADREKRFLFQTLQNSTEKKSFDTVIVIDHDASYRHFDAIFKIGSELGGIYRAVAVFRLIPRSWRNSLYLWIAKNRFRWFGVRVSCYLPSAEEQERFI